MISTIRGKPAVGIVLVLLIVAAVAYINMRGGNREPSTGRWFYDMASGELLRIATADPPPITLDGGHEAVWAHVFSCGSCDDADQRFVGFIETFDDQAPEAAQQANTDGPMIAGTNEPGPRSRVALPKEPVEWFTATSPQAMAIRSGMTQRCPNDRPKPCR